MKWIGLVVIAAAVGIAVAGSAFGSPGAESKKDGCHNMKRDGVVVERHFHSPAGTRKRGGLCETLDSGVHVRYVEVKAPMDAAHAQALASAQAAAVVARQELASVRSALDASKSAESAWRDRARVNANRADRATREAREARDRVSEIAAELAGARSGEPPCVGPRERLAGRVAETWASGWRTEARALIRCLSDG